MRSKCYQTGWRNAKMTPIWARVAAVNIGIPPTKSQTTPSAIAPIARKISTPIPCKTILVNHNSLRVKAILVSNKANVPCRPTTSRRSRFCATPESVLTESCFRY